MLVETLLEWEAYLNEPEMQKKHVHRLVKKHRYIMYLIKKVAKRTEGMGLKIMKYHAILHMVEDIFLYGVPLVFDTAANESHHKVSKVAAKLTQRNIRYFNKQVANRLLEFLAIELGMLEIEDDRCRYDYFWDLEKKTEDEVENPHGGG